MATHVFNAVLFFVFWVIAVIYIAFFTPMKYLFMLAIGLQILGWLLKKLGEI